MRFISPSISSSTVFCEKGNSVFSIHHPTNSRMMTSGADDKELSGFAKNYIESLGAGDADEQTLLALKIGAEMVADTPESTETDLT